MLRRCAIRSTVVCALVSIAADFGGHYKHQTTFVEDVSLTDHTLAAGPRVAARIAGPSRQSSFAE
jgi:hypothetical protein